MLNRLITKSIFLHWRQTSALLFIFFAIRLFSFFAFTHTFLNQAVALLIIILFTYLCFKNLSHAWLALVIELLLDGAGHFLELKHLILRTWFLGIFAGFWLFKKIKEKKWGLPLPRLLTMGLAGVAMIIAWSISRGFANGHNALFILQDVMLYFFLLLFLPGLDFKEYLDERLAAIIKIFIIGSALFSLITFFIYASGLGTLPDAYYHWFRNVAAGKITDLGNNFFRVVLPEQLFIVPLILILVSGLISKHKSKPLEWLLFACSLMILILNFSRIYFLALTFGLIILLYKNSFRQWLRVSVCLAFLAAAIFISLNLLASRGASLGLDILGMKVRSAAAPQTDLSGAIRMAMLPDIISTIKKYPLAGSGLGAAVSYLDPLTKETVTRTQFDWGYLEMIAELGAVGAAVFILFLSILLYYLFRLAYSPANADNEKTPLARGLFAGALSLFVINLTTPALSQGFGILFFAFLITIISQREEMPLC